MLNNLFIMVKSPLGISKGQCKNSTHLKIRMTINTSEFHVGDKLYKSKISLQLAYSNFMFKTKI